MAAIWSGRGRSWPRSGHAPTSCATATWCCGCAGSWRWRSASPTWRGRRSSRWPSRPARAWRRLHRGGWPTATGTTAGAPRPRPRTRSCWPPRTPSATPTSARCASASPPPPLVPARTAALREFLREHPAHPLAVEAEQLFIAATGAAPVWTDRERIARAKTMHAAHQWHEAVAELALVAETAPQAVRDAHDAELGKTLFDMRRRYGEAGELLLRVYPRLGAGAPEAMFHGARALSRADRDDEAITWYDKFVAAYPRAPDAAEAQYLSGWARVQPRSLQGGPAGAAGHARSLWRQQVRLARAVVPGHVALPARRLRGCREAPRARSARPTRRSRAAKASTGWPGPTSKPAPAPRRCASSPASCGAGRSPGTRCWPARGWPRPASSSGRLAMSPAPTRPRRAAPRSRPRSIRPTRPSCRCWPASTS
jgi:hypothetical protein